MYSTILCFLLLPLGALEAGIDMVSLTEIAVSSIVACAGTVAVVPIVRPVCKLMGAVDDPSRDSRRVHAAPVVRGCGIAVIIVAVIILGRFETWLLDPPIMVGLIALTGVGLIDDIRGVRPLLKLTCQALAVGCMLWWAGLGKTDIGLPLTEERLSFAPLVSLFYFVLGIGMVNALNLIDGLDGLASGIGTVICLGLAVLAFHSGNEPVLIGSGVLGGSLMGFLVWNTHPAKVFLGDAGSLVIGFLITVLMLGLVHPPSGTADEAYGIAVPLLLLLLPWADCVWVMLRRLLHGRHPFAADRSHIHHYCLDLGLRHNEATTLLIGLTGLVAVIAILLRDHGRDVLFLVMVILIQSVVGGLRILKRTSLYRLDQLARRRAVRRSKIRPRLVMALGVYCVAVAIVQAALLLPALPLLTRQDLILLATVALPIASLALFLRARRGMLFQLASLIAIAVIAPRAVAGLQAFLSFDLMVALPLVQLLIAGSLMVSAHRLYLSLPAPEAVVLVGGAGAACLSWGGNLTPGLSQIALLASSAFLILHLDGIIFRRRVLASIRGIYGDQGQPRLGLDPH